MAVDKNKLSAKVRPNLVLKSSNFHLALVQKKKLMMISREKKLSVSKVGGKSWSFRLVGPGEAINVSVSNLVRYRTEKSLVNL